MYEPSDLQQNTESTAQVADGSDISRVRHCAIVQCLIFMQRSDTMAGRHTMKDEDGNTVEKPLKDACDDEVETDTKKSEFAPYVGIRKTYSGSLPHYKKLQKKINSYLNADIVHTFNGLALYLECDPQHLKDLESGKYDHPKTNYKPSDLLKQFRLYMENELYTALPLKNDKDVERLAGKPPEEEEKDKEIDKNINQYAK